MAAVRLPCIAALALLASASPALAQDFVVAEGGSSGQILNLGNTRAASIARAITIEPKEESDLTKVRVALSDGALQHSNGFNYTAKFLPDAVVQAKKIRGRIDAKLPVTGTYTGTLAIQMTDGRVLDRIAVTVTRDAVEVPLSVGAMHALVQESAKPFTFTTTLRSTAARPLDLDAPTIAATRTIGEIVTDAKNATVTIIDGEGQGVTAMRVPPRAATVRLRVAGLDEPAKYDATIAFHARGFEPVLKTVTIYVRRSWPTAAWYIFLGVLSSFLLRFYWTERRPRLLVERHYHLLQAKIRQIARGVTDDDEALSVLAIVSTFLDDTFTELALQSKWNETAPFATMETKIAVARSWVTARQAARAARPESLRNSFLATLAPIEAALRTSSTTAEDMKAHEETLKTFHTTLKEEAKKAAAETIAKLRTQAAAFAAVRKNAATELATLTIEAENLLNQEQIANALDVWEAASGKLAEILAREAAADFAVKPFPGFDDISWKNLGAAIAPRLENLKKLRGESAILALDVVLGDYLRALRDGLERAPKPEDPSVVQGHITTATEKLAAGELAAAWSAIIAGRNALESPAAPPSDWEMQLVIENGRLTDAALARPEWSTEGIIPPTTRDLEDVRSALFWGDVWSGLAILLIVTLLGVKVLWSTDLAWGSWLDRLGAFLWGLGLHQFSYEGMSGLVNKLKS